MGKEANKYHLSWTGWSSTATSFCLSYSSVVPYHHGNLFWAAIIRSSWWWLYLEPQYVLSLLIFLHFFPSVPSMGYQYSKESFCSWRRDHSWQSGVLGCTWNSHQNKYMRWEYLCYRRCTGSSCPWALVPKRAKWPLCTIRRLQYYKRHIIVGVLFQILDWSKIFKLCLWDHSSRPDLSFTFLWSLMNLIFEKTTLLNMVVISKRLHSSYFWK